MESDSLMPCPSCACEVSKTYATHFEQQRLMQFLLGLNETYNQCRSQLMMMDPRLNVNKAHFLVITEECQRVLGKSNIASIEATDPGQPLDAVTFFSSSKGHTSGSGSSSHSGSSFKPHRTSNNNLYCDYCNWKGHIRANCFRLHGYPANWKGKRRSPRSITAANLAKGSSPQSTTGHVNCSHGSVFEVKVLLLAVQQRDLNFIKDLSHQVLVYLTLVLLMHLCLMCSHIIPIHTVAHSSAIYVAVSESTIYICSSISPLNRRMAGLKVTSICNSHVCLIVLLKFLLVLNGS